MMDQYLQEQHAYHITQRVHHRSRSSADQSLNSNKGSSWVMIRNGGIVRLEHEEIKLKLNKIGLDLGVPKSLQQGRTPFSHKSDSGTVYITTRRVIYVPTQSTEEFKSFQAWILNCQDSYVGSPLFGAWYWMATVKPSPGGGVPPDIPRLELKLTFREGGHSEFGQKFEEMKERMEHITRLRQETGQSINIPDEPLPAYEARPAGAQAGATNDLAIPAQPPVNRSSSSASQNPGPNEPPPGYDEAQAQTLSMRLEDHMRGESERS